MDWDGPGERQAEAPCPFRRHVYEIADVTFKWNVSEWATTLPGTHPTETTRLRLRGPSGYLYALGFTTK